MLSCLVDLKTHNKLKFLWSGQAENRTGNWLLLLRLVTFHLLCYSLGQMWEQLCIVQLKPWAVRCFNDLVQTR